MEPASMAAWAVKYHHWNAEASIQWLSDMVDITGQRVRPTDVEDRRLPLAGDAVTPPSPEGTDLLLGHEHTEARSAIGKVLPDVAEPGAGGYLLHGIPTGDAEREAGVS